MSSSVAVKSISNEANENEKNGINRSDDTWKLKAKHPRRMRTATVKKEQRPSYSPEFKAEILNFVKKNSKVIAVRQFGIPESTLRDWISRDTSIASENDKEAKTQLKIAEDCVPKSFASAVTKCSEYPQVIDQDSLSMIVDIPSIIIKEPHYQQELNHDVVGEDVGESMSPTVTAFVRKDLKQVSSEKKISYGKEVKDEIVQYGVDHRSWKEAASKYSVSPSSVQAWAKRAGIRLLAGRRSRMGMEVIIQYGVKQGSWKEAAVKFGVPLYTVKFWARKAGYDSQERKSRGKMQVSNEDKVQKGRAGVSLLKVRKSGVGMEEILQYVVKQNCWKEAAEKFGVSPFTVSSWAKKTGYKLQIKKSRVKERMSNNNPCSNTAGIKQSEGEKSGVRKEEILQYGLKQNSWNEAAEKFGVSPCTVQSWAKRAGMKLSGKRKSRMGMEEILQYGMKQNSWNEAAVKFGVSLYTVKYWAKKTGYSLTKSQKYSDDFKKTVVSFGEIDGWRAASRKFKVGSFSVREWAKKLGKKKREPKGSTDIGAKQEMIKYGVKQNSLKEAASKCGLSEQTVSGLDGKTCHKLSMEKANKVKPTRLATDSGNLSMLAAGEAEVASRCEACGLRLAVNETHDEHVVSRHLTVEGLCDICGQDSEDFIEHFKIHLINQVLDLPPLDILGNIVKEESLPMDENWNCKDAIDSDVTEECEESDFKEGGRWVVNPFFDC